MEGTGMACGFISSRPPLGMLAAAEVFLLARESKRPYCAKLHHHHEKRCIFRHSDWTHQRR